MRTLRACEKVASRSQVSLLNQDFPPTAEAAAALGEHVRGAISALDLSASQQRADDIGLTLARYDRSGPDGSGLINVTNEGPAGYKYLSGSFSPDGRRIATARTPETGPEGAADLVVLNADGSGARRLTKTRLWESAADWGSARPLR